MDFLIAIIVGVLIVVPLWRICVRAGFNGALSLIAIIPFGFLIVAGILSFRNWPNAAKTIKDRK